jgi:hypothetical protein
MFDWSTFVTGAVGVAGIAGTIIAARLTSKSQSADLVTYIESEADRGEIAEKRRIYAACLASLARMLRASVDKATAESDAKSVASAELVSAEKQIYLAISELQLMAPSVVVDLAVEVVAHFYDYAFGQEWMDGYNMRESEMLTAMRTDLQVRSLPQLVRTESTPSAARYS